MAIGNERTVSLVQYRNGLSTDTKPIRANHGDLFYEIDRGDTYEFNNNIWNLKKNHTDFTFHDASTTVVAGNEFTVGNYKTLTVEVYGTSATRTVNFKALSFSGTARDILGLKIGTSTTAITTTGAGEIWQFGIEGLDKIYFDLSAVTGGNVTIKGRATK